jgi:CubicO group peptidase (beta-lactamase class C family)
MLLVPAVLLHTSLSAQQMGIDSLLNGLGDKNQAVRWNSVVALSKLGEAAVPALAQGLTARNPDVRAGAARALAGIGKPATAALQELCRALEDPQEMVRQSAAEALGGIGTGAAAAIAPLLARLSDADPFVIGSAAEALGRIGTAAVPGLIRVLESREAASWPSTIALGKIGPDAAPAVPALARALSSEQEKVRWGAAMALANIGRIAEPAVTPLLARLSDADQDVRWASSLALDRISPGVIEAQADWRTIASIIDTLAPRLMSETGVPGAAITLVSGGEIVWSGHYGVTSTSGGRPVTGETVFEACSMSKPVFAYLVLQLVEEGRLVLDRPLVDYLEAPSFPTQPEYRQITARMVLSHTSGLPNWRKGEEERGGPLPVLFTPGTRFGYSGEAFFLLQQVIEKVTGEPVDLVARRRLLEPLSMAHTSFIWSGDLAPLVSEGHDASGSPLPPVRYTHANVAYTLYTTPQDYARFLLAILHPSATLAGHLSPESCAMMFSPHVAVTAREPIERPGKAKGASVSWGLGWSLNITPGGEIAHHSGANRTGFRCFSQFHLSRGTGIIIMTNGTGGGDLWTRLVSRIGNF